MYKFPDTNEALGSPQENRDPPRGPARTIIEQALDGAKIALLGTVGGLVSICTIYIWERLFYDRRLIIMPDGGELITDSHPPNCHVGTLHIDHAVYHVTRMNSTELKRFKNHPEFKKKGMEFEIIGSVETLGGKIHFLNMHEDLWPKFQSWWDKTKRKPNGDSLSHENVKFLDEVSGHEAGFSTGADEVREATSISDADLGNFFSRPVLIKSYVVAPQTAVDDSFAPWNLFFSDPYVARRLSNFKLLSCNLKVKFVINGAPFHYGRFLVSYTPMGGFDEMTRDRTALPGDIVGLSQRPHLFLDPTASSGGTMTLPFMWFKNKIDIISPTDFLDMGTMRLLTLNQVKHSNGATDPVTISVYAWAENVQISVPTTHLPISVPPIPTLSQAYRMRKPDGASDEYGMGPVSKPASVVASMAAAMTRVPAIAPFARATEIGAMAVGKMASLFGYSKPVLLTTGHYRPNPKPTAATSNQDDDCNKLSLDCKQELSIDPTLFGGIAQDEMEINYIAGVQSYLDTFVFPVSASSEELLWRCTVDPALYKIEGSGDSKEHHLTSLAYAAAPFKKWRGTIKYRFQIVCSKYHRGRIKVVYDPEGISPLTAQQANYNTAYTTVVDLKDTTDFTVNVGWGQSTTYRDVADYLTPPADNFGPGESFYLSSLDPWGNGVIAVYCVTELAVPDSTINNDISINVFVSAGDDFELAVPTGEVVARFRTLTPAETTPVALAQVEPRRPQRRPDGATKEEDTTHQQDQDADNPDSAPLVDTHGPTMSLSDKTNLVHFGETIRSFRQLIKRYSMHECIPVIRDISATPGVKDFYNIIQRHALPFEPGYTNSALNPQGPVQYELLKGKYAYGTLTPLRYLTLAFVGWRGGIRYVLDHSELACDCSHIEFNTTRYSECNMLEKADNPLAQVNGPLRRDQIGEFHRDVTCQEGGVISSAAVNPVISFEVPYYSEYRFAPARKLVDFSTAGSFPWMPCFKHKTRVVLDDASGQPQEHFYLRTYRSYVAAAEDFQVSGFIGAPPLYYEVDIPGV